jgi:hypothetical protein
MNADSNQLADDDDKLRVSNSGRTSTRLADLPRAGGTRLRSETSPAGKTPFHIETCRHCRGGETVTTPRCLRANMFCCSTDGSSHLWPEPVAQERPPTTMSFHRFVRRSFRWPLCCFLCMRALRLANPRLKLASLASSPSSTSEDRRPFENSFVSDPGGPRRS